MPVFYDTHAHLDFPDFANDLDAVIARAVAAGVTRMLCIGTNLQSSRRAIAIAVAHPEVWAVAGWHPSAALLAPADIRGELRKLAEHPRLVAIGETGLDYYRLPSSTGGSRGDDDQFKQAQASLFTQQLEVAAELGLNCVIHQRGDTLEDTLALMKPFAGRVRGVFHCFAGSIADVAKIRALGSMVSFTGIVTFKNGQNVREAVAATPLGEFMLETDCPFLAPVPHRGKRCEPGHVKEIAAVVAEARGCSLEELSEATRDAAHKFFPRMPLA
jgi:TatD DNase family protein